ncbi:MAG TPA: dihydrolipoamide acetyltransferase family protein [Acidimicrobiales bacterium]|nr:dihydrolipoamide acetyltransferase family protein [Acidimicrobiales bacterium]
MTPRDFHLPDLGEGLEDAEIVRWLVAEGDVVAVDQPIVEVVTAKANLELPSPFGGVIARLYHEAGDVVPVGAPLVSVAEPAESGAALPSASEPGGSAAAAAGSGSLLVGYGTRPERRRRRRAGVPTAAGAAGATGAAAAATGAAAPATGAAQAAAAAAAAPAAASARRPAVLSPVVRRLARELRVNLSVVEGSGPEGVITRRDIERAAAASDTAAAGAAAPGAGERLVIRGAHRQMAERLARSRREIPEATVWVDADATGLLEAKRAIDQANPDRPAGVGITSWLARFCVLGLRSWPLLNSRMEGDEIVLSEHVNLGIAVQTGSGLVVPVVHHAEEMSLLELDDEIRRLAGAARQRQLRPSELTGGTFTLNNYGVFGVDGSAAIINFPEVAIVGVGRLLERPWVVDGEVRARTVTELTLAFDHRVCDGAVAGGYLRFVADCVEQPVRLLTL